MSSVLALFLDVLIISQVRFDFTPLDFHTCLNITAWHITLFDCSTFTASSRHSWSTFNRHFWSPSHRHFWSTLHRHFWSLSHRHFWSTSLCHFFVDCPLIKTVPNFQTLLNTLLEKHHTPPEKNIYEQLHRAFISTKDYKNSRTNAYEQPHSTPPP